MSSNRSIRSWLLGAVAVLTLAGCAGTRSSGEKRFETDRPVDRIGVLVQPAAFEGWSAAATIGNRDVAALLPLLVARVPAIFRLNRIESRAAEAAVTAGVPAELAAFRFVLRIWPTTATWSGRGGSTLTIGSELSDRETGKVVWSGSVLFGRSFGGAPDAALADKVAVQLLDQLLEDRVIALHTPKLLNRLPEDATPAQSSTAVATLVPASRVRGAAASGPQGRSARDPAVPLEHTRQVPPATAFAAIGDIDAVPVRADGKERYRHFLGLPPPKAFVVHASGGWRFWWNDGAAMTKALSYCAAEKNPCWLYAVDNRVVWDSDVKKRIGEPSQLVD